MPGPGVQELFHIVDEPSSHQGDVSTVLLLGSLGSTLAMWDGQAAALGRRYRVVRADLRGHGRSPAPTGPYGIGDLGADVLALLDRLGVERSHVCGLSLGGMIAMWVASHAPERIGRLVLMCTSARLEPTQAWSDRARMVRAGGMEAVADAVVGRWFTSGFAASHRDLVARMRTMIASTPPEGYAGCCEAIATRRTAAGPRRHPRSHALPRRC